MNTAFKNCPSCSSKNVSFHPKHRLECKACGFVFFQNTAAAVATLLMYNGSILAVQRNQQPQMGKWDLPGGFVDPNEQAQQACAREIKEELGLDLMPEAFRYVNSYPNVYPYKAITYHTLDLFFSVELSSDYDVKIDKEELQDFKWVNLTVAEKYDWAFDSMKSFFSNGTNIASLIKK